MSTFRIWLDATRPTTLSAAVAPVLLGTGVAVHEGLFDWRAVGICLVFALLMQIGTNFANDYLDGIKGADRQSRIGPRRAVASGLVRAQVMRRAAITVLAVGFCAGLGLIPLGGWWLLGVGVASVACAWLYTGGPFPLAYNGLGDVFVVLFFGFVAVGGTYYVQTGGVTGDVLLLGLGCGLLVNNILVVNNYRDMKEDMAAHKRTLIVLFGREFGLVFYLVSAGIAGAVAIWFCVRGYGWLVLAGLLPTLHSVQLAIALRCASDPPDYSAALKGAGMVVAAYGLLFAAGLCLASQGA